MFTYIFRAIFIFSLLENFINANGQKKVGLIIKKGEEDKWLIVQQVLRSEQTSDVNNNRDIQVLKETVDVEDTFHYHRAFCSMLDNDIDALISSTASPYYPVLSAYAREYQIPLISPDLPQEVSQFLTNYSFGMKPITARPMLKLFQQYRWSDIVYFYDDDNGPENLNLIFTVGRQILDLKLSGMLRVTSAKEANEYLRKLDKAYKNKDFHVILDTELFMARDILVLHVNDIHVRKKNFHFLVPKPTLEEFWIPHKAAFGAINVTTFLIQHHLPEAESMIHHVLNGSEKDFDLLPYYYFDAALVLKEALSNIRRLRPFIGTTQKNPARNCMNAIPQPSHKGYLLSRIIQDIKINGSTGSIQFLNGQRQLDLNITEITPQGFTQIAYWTRGNLHPTVSSQRERPTALPLIQTNGKLQIVTKVHPPYMMLKNEVNGSLYQGNDRFEGYCKDIIDYLAAEMKFEYDLHLVEDNTYGNYIKSQGKWTGIIGELIQGKADLAVADLRITGQRQRVVEFTDPFEVVGFSLVMKNPLHISKSHILFFLSAFTADVWICIIFSVILFCILFHFITKFTGAPDSIESASGIWGRKHAAIVNIWFAIGSSMFQGTGVYPRSISSRILSGFCWFFTLILSSLFVASITSQVLGSRLSSAKNPQVAQLGSLSLESIIAESVSRGWPKVGLVKSSNTELFIKRSTIPIFAEFSKYLENNPDVIVATAEEGIKRVRESSGNYIVLVESLTAEYAIRRKPCDIIATHDAISYSGYGFATPLGSELIYNLNKNLHIIQMRGALGDLHRKWWIDSSECKNVVISDREERTIHVFSGLMCLSAIGILVVLGVFGVQYFRRNQNKESRRQQLSFEDMNLGQPLPTPPPELLAEPPPVLNLPELDRRTLL